MADKTVSAEDSFRDSLLDVITIADKLRQHCKSVEDLIGICELATKNEGQLALLMNIVTGPQSIKR